MTRRLVVPCMAVAALVASTARAQVAVRGETVYTMAGAPLRDAVVLVKNGKIEKVGAGVTVPAGYRELRAKVVTPGLIDAHSVVGLAGYLNQPQDQDQLDTANPIQPELRAIDAYNPDERLIAWIRGFGVTTIHTGHGPGALVSGQTMVAKTRGKDVDAAVMVPTAMIAATLGKGAQTSEEGKSPGTRAKAVALLRAELVKAQEYEAKKQNAEKGKEPEKNLRLEALAMLLRREVPLLVTANRADDLRTALRLAEEFKLRVVLDGAAEAYLMKDAIAKAAVPVILHPTLARDFGEAENMSKESASILKKAGIRVALQSGFESYVPKTRVVLFEAGMTAAFGLTPEEALATITIDAARILGIDKRVGSLEAGKDGDLALYDGDPFSWTSHCVGTVIEGEVVSDTAN
jgi:imidazolonepropionase-like amidohydrolase